MQKKTCCKKQHVDIYKRRKIPKIIRRKTAVGKNYKMTRYNTPILSIR